MVIFGHISGHELLLTRTRSASLVTVAPDNTLDTGHE